MNFNLLKYRGVFDRGSQKTILSKQDHEYAGQPLV